MAVSVFTDQEQLTTFKRLLHEVHTARSVTMNKKRIIDLLDLISQWSYAHSDGNGERSEEDIQDRIDGVLFRMRRYMEGWG